MENQWAVGKELNLPKLNVSNDIINDADALEVAFDRDGYWFFEDVLDHDAIHALREAYVSELVDLGVMDAGDPQFRYNGASLEAMPENPVAGVLEGIFRRAPWKEFVKVPAIHALFQRILQDDPAWMPIIGYRVGKPGGDPDKERFDFVHQDGFYNPGIPFLNCWVPLVNMDDDIGGIAVAEGYHKKPDMHIQGEAPAYAMPYDAIPKSAWRMAQYKPGDLLVLHLDVPHSGVANISKDRFRMSLDIRMLPASGQLPTIGTLSEIASDHIVVKDDKGNEINLNVNDDTYCRGPVTNAGKRINSSELSEYYDLGDSVIIAHKDGIATVVRPAAY